MAQINKPDEYFNTVLYTGNASTNNITGVGFQPDFCWLKSRSNSTDHTLFDFVRGATKRLETNTTGSELTASQSLQSFDSDGFTLGDSLSVNIDDATYASWNWLAGGTGVSNTDGSITSTVSANTTNGFSIVSWSGNATASTIGHSLGTAPSMIIAKNRNDATNWFVGHNSLGWTKYIVLNTTGAEVTDTVWNDTAPTSSVFSVGTFNSINGSGDDMIAYCFAEKKGFSKFGSYTGSSGLPFIYTGFKPAFVMFKNASTTANWGMIDNKRDDDNVVKARLFPNLSDTESSSFDICDFTANGFKLRTTDSQFNSSGNTFIYMCFAESPLVGTNNTPATAR